MSGFQCPYCSMIMPLTAGTKSTQYPSFDHERGVGINGTDDSCIELTFYKCPNCNQYSITANGIGYALNDVQATIRPKSFAKQFPDYIPQGIRQDYIEASDIVALSPKAAATLSRRCLQGIIRDFWELKNLIFQKPLKNLMDSFRFLYGT